ncbi:hypothetical protein LXG23DRAFT_39321 [Yarrowia lipolytica]|nr:hypothetical protein BKA91DRAFT_131236 [Yarrowia lipolytica]KAE8168775.1 hypothetical protein BKA90DRAFT_132212 [Yarrowia lipolytica]KAJ8051616.1 hypothetical protein LXG23DRAFT_39321 [Yarrowia lipolytica]RMI95124.1 hypothetical protein BD777DRAFT_137682 [Yarrowia lipolytica]
MTAARSMFQVAKLAGAHTIIASDSQTEVVDPWLSDKSSGHFETNIEAISMNYERDRMNVQAVLVNRDLGQNLLVEVLRGQREASASWTLSHGTAAYFRDETSPGPECDSEESDGEPEDDRDALDSLFLPNYEQERHSAFRRTPNRRYCEKRPSVRRNQVRDDYQRRNQVRDDYDGRRRRRARDDRETRTFTRRAAISQILPQPF